MRITSLLVLVLALATVRPANAQSALWVPPVSQGKNVRIGVADSTITLTKGRYWGVTADSVRVELARGATAAVAIPRIVYIDESSGRSRWRFAAIGALVGATVGGAIGAMSGEHEDPGGIGGLVGLIAGGIAGAPLGAIAGFVLAPERWTRHWNPARR